MRSGVVGVGDLHTLEYPTRVAGSSAS
jgi:hypothetical protein